MPKEEYALAKEIGVTQKTARFEYKVTGGTDDTVDEIDKLCEEING